MDVLKFDGLKADEHTWVESKADGSIHRVNPGDVVDPSTIVRPMGYQARKQASLVPSPKSVKFTDGQIVFPSDEVIPDSADSAKH